MNEHSKSLALEIANCSNVSAALKDPRHPCRKVVAWQATQLPILTGASDYTDTCAHRPEGWTGTLESAPIMFLASNPSFDPLEAYPDWTSDWPTERLLPFATDRFGASEARPFGATDDADPDRTYRTDTSLSRRVNHWAIVRHLAATTLGRDVSEVSARDDYVMTELVHCKSFNEVGVPDALTTCAATWLDKIFRVSPAKIVFVLGVKPAKHLVELIPTIPETWGAWSVSGQKRGDWPSTRDELVQRTATGSWGPAQQRKHTTTLTLGGRERTFVWLPRGGSSIPWSLWADPPVVDSSVIAEWRSVL